MYHKEVKLFSVGQIASKGRIKMKILKLAQSILLIFAFLPASSWAQEDLFTRKKSDIAIKPLVFPLSMVVLENRPGKGLYYFYEGNKEKFDEGLNGEPASIDSQIYSVLSDPRTIIKSLVATDPTRIAPSQRGEDIPGTITKKGLKKLSQKYSKDLFLVFRREIRFLTETSLPDSLFLHPDELLNHTWSQSDQIQIKCMGLVYLAKQDKALWVPSNAKSMSLPADKEKIKVQLRQLAKKGLEDLAASARKTIRDKQFVIRRPSY